MDERKPPMRKSAPTLAFASVMCVTSPSVRAADEKADAAADVPRAQGVLGDGVPKFTVRPGYRVTLVAQDLKEARFITFDDAGTLYLSQPNSTGSILALRDTDEDGSFEYVAP